jgi:hypothetical protein
MSLAMVYYITTLFITDFIDRMLKALYEVLKTTTFPRMILIRLQAKGRKPIPLDPAHPATPDLQRCNTLDFLKTFHEMMHKIQNEQSGTNSINELPKMMLTQSSNASRNKLISTWNLLDHHHLLRRKLSRVLIFSHLLNKIYAYIRCF